mgnify:CR=1 FL=1
MPSLVTYPFKGLKAKIGVTFLTLNEKPECLIISPGGCGTVSLIKYLNKFIKSNNYFEKKYSNVGIGHLYKPNKFLIKNKNFKPEKGNHCNWCDYKDLSCPAWED